MAGYQIVQFGGVDLPLYNAKQALDVAPAQSGLLATAGGAFDVRGDRRGLQVQQAIEITGLYYGETTYIVDHLGNQIVDHAGNRIIAGTGPNLLRAQIDNLRAMVGSRATLWRRRMDSDERQWVTARLLSLAHPAKVSDRQVLAEVTARFVSALAGWRAAAATVAAGSIAAGGLAGLTAHNGGQLRVDDAVLTVTATGTVTRVTVAGPGIDWTWSGSLGAGQSLIVDCGAATVRAAGADGYAGLALGGGHTADDWLALAAGTTVLLVGADAAATVSLQFYNQFL